MKMQELNYKKKVMETFVVKGDWRKRKITEKQYDAIINMRSALGWKCDIPNTQGAANKLITEMHGEIVKRLSITGKIGYAPEFDSANEIAEEDRDELDWYSDMEEEF